MNKCILFVIFLFTTVLSHAQLEVNIVGTQGPGGAKEIAAHVHPFETGTGNHIGLVALTHPFIETEPNTTFFFNNEFGIAMNRNVSFTGSPEIIHNGGTSTEWTGSSIQGDWNFADSDKITITTANNNDESEYAEEGGSFIKMSDFTAITGKIDLDVYNDANNNITVEFDLTGVVVGNSVDLNDFIDTGNFSEQNFVIPKGSMGLTSQPVDGFNIVMLRSGGARPTVKFDDIQVEAAGSPATFFLNVDKGRRFHIEEIVFTYVDNILSEKTGLSGDTEAFTNDFLSFDAFLGVSELSNGFVITRTKGGKTLFSATIRSLGAHISAGAVIGELITDNTNTLITLRAVFQQMLILTGDPDDTLSITINDDMSGLVQFTAAGRGSLE